MIQKRNVRKRQGTRGGVLVEFALAALVLTPVILGTFSFGLAIRDYNALQTAVRNAARWASLQDYDSSSSTPSATFETRVKNLVLYGDPNGQGSLTVSKLTAGNVQLTVTMQNNLPYQMTVSIVNYPLVDFFRPITLNNKPAATFPFMGRYVPPV